MQRIHWMSGILTFSVGTSCAGAEKSTHDMELVKDGKPQCTLVLPETETPASRLACLELQYHVEAMTGARLPVTRSGEQVQGALQIRCAGLANADVNDADGVRHDEAPDASWR